MSTKSLNKHFIARVLDRAAMSGNLDPELAQQCVDLVAEIDAGKGGIPARVEALLSGAVEQAAFAAADAKRPAEQRRALTAIRCVVGLMRQLGLAPQPAAETEPESAPAPEPLDDDSYGYSDEPSFGGAA